jgi:hypothetical protein
MFSPADGGAGKDIDNFIVEVALVQRIASASSSPTGS